MEEEKSYPRSYLETQLIDSIRDSLSNYLSPNATFLAERLFYERDTEEYRGILAECYISENRYYKAYHILQSTKSEENRYKLAITCNRLGKLKEAEKALLSSNYNDFLSNKYTSQSAYKLDNVPNGSFGIYLLGVINEKQQKFQEAKDYYLKALDLNPTLWIAYEKLCKLGDDIVPSKVFSEVKYKIYENSKKKNSQSMISSEALLQTQKNSKNPILKGKSGDKTVSHSDKIISSDAIHENEPESNQVPGFINKSRMINPIKSMNFGSVGENVFGSLKKSKEKEVLTPDPIHNTRKNVQKSDLSVSEFPVFKDIITMLKRLAEPYHDMSQYYCAKAIDLFKKLPSNQLNSGWVLSNIARCYMECIKYTDAERYFSESLRIEPHRLEGIEYYSSCLWHLKKQVELCALAHDALEKSRFAAEAWIAAGNCFSLQKEHENALKFFNRAIQLSPQNAYAHSLCGHEYVYNEDFQNARKHFETSLSFDIRHYNAWWGLGNIHYKQEKYEKALENFDRAIRINTNCPVLYSYMGMTLNSMRRFGEALNKFDKAEILDPNNVLNRFQKAGVLVQLEKFDQALIELDKLRLMMPKEAPIPILMGKIYKKLNKIEKAHFFFNLALDLEPKDTQRIKSLIDSLQNNNEFNEDLEFF